ncbi:MAG TPA: hypothetical protein VJI15_01660 [Candidatus Nanoarchaeia archaeon]|nr:hypothetical protein [Candidatus Nanoarchaeia archaeon]
MVDLTNTTIKRLFEKQIRELTMRTILPQEEYFDYQFSGAWLR